jgi:hypothetical protein
MVSGGSAVRWQAVCCAVLLAACSRDVPPTQTEAQDLDAVAEEWVRLALEIDTHEAGYVDAYYGPAEWREQAHAAPRSIAELKEAADELVAMLRALTERGGDALPKRRARTMLAAVSSARFRLDMIDGGRVPFVDEAARLFGLRPELHPLEDYDAVVASIEAMLPGEGPLADRVEAFRSRYEIESDRLRAVMDRAIAECRARTLAHIELPETERFTLEFVDHKSWSAYNYYFGNDQSLIQVNTDLPITIDRALTLGCHEGYPGHHVQGIYNERLYRRRGWVEFSVAPLYHPSSPMNEGAGNYGVELAFPADERLEFERDVLYPLAGLDPSTAAPFAALRKALAALAGARLTVAALYLDGKIDREHAVALSQRYGLTSRARAEQSVRFDDDYRSYVINYSTGEDVVRAFVERAGASADARWAAFERIMAEPTVPADLL